MVGFTASIAVGWAAGNSAPTTIMRSIGAFLVCLFVGKAVGFVAQRTIEDSVAAYKKENPIPEDPLANGALDAIGTNVDIIEEGESVPDKPEMKEPRNQATSRSAA